jgi:hypothetical protein
MILKSSSYLILQKETRAAGTFPPEGFVLCLAGKGRLDAVVSSRSRLFEEKKNR